MKNTLRCLMPAICLLLAYSIAAQRGLPAPANTKSKVATNYPQVLDFTPEMVKMLKVPAGWQVDIAAYGLGHPRMLYAGSNNQLYITRRDAGDVLMLKDNNNDGKLEDLITIVADFKGVHGITVKDDWLYLCNNTELRRYKMSADGTVGQVEVLIKDLPNGGQHPNRTMDFGPDGLLYMSIGSTCNDCKEADKEMATILQIDPKTWKRTVFASGLRNTIGFDWQPKTNEMWGVDNGRDWQGDKWPPEELNHLIQGANYGFPYAYGKREIDETREDPAGNSKAEVVKGTQPSVLEFPAHSAPIAFKFFGVTANIPSEYAGDALVCWHGSWNSSDPVGYKVQRIRFSNGAAVGAEDFLTGFLKGNTRFGRPAGVAITLSGTVYISDDANGVLYAIKRTGTNTTSGL